MRDPREPIKLNVLGVGHPGKTATNLFSKALGLVEVELKLFDGLGCKANKLCNTTVSDKLGPGVLDGLQNLGRGNRGQGRRGIATPLNFF